MSEYVSISVNYRYCRTCGIIRYWSWIWKWSVNQRIWTVERQGCYDDRVAWKNYCSSYSSWFYNTLITDSLRITFRNKLISRDWIRWWCSDNDIHWKIYSTASFLHRAYCYRTIRNLRMSKYFRVAIYHNFVWSSWKVWNCCWISDRFSNKRIWTIKSQSWNSNLIFSVRKKFICFFCITLKTKF